MSAHSDLEKMYRQQGNDVLADAVQCLLETEEKVGRFYSCLATPVELPRNEDVMAFCKDISTMLKNEEIVANDLKNYHSVDSSDYFSDLRELQSKHC